MPKINKYCGFCGVIEDKLGRKYIQILKTTPIRAYKPENPTAKRNRGEHKGSFAAEYILIGLFCPRCKTLYLDSTFEYRTDADKLFPLKMVSDEELKSFEAILGPKKVSKKAEAEDLEITNIYSVWAYRMRNYRYTIPAIEILQQFEKLIREDEQGKIKIKMEVGGGESNVG